MTATNLQPCLSFTLTEEGGYQRLSGDPGNWYRGRLIGTNMGISAVTLAAWLRRGVEISDMRDLTVETASAIYRQNYWQEVRGDTLPSGLDLMGFDYGVNAGVGASLSALSDSAVAGVAYQAMNMGRSRLRVLQDRLGVTTDGIYGPITSSALAESQPGQQVARILYVSRLQERRYRSLDGFPQFGAGWLARLARRQARALELFDGVSA
ncbi:hypothetical protein J2D73_16820 [Acetobacter sacchari]|uniref:TtsA-like Glycoside hydrolase family 108 domain-containing protein n=1 Tax=Acetobacter sacchari TaxID=2661687 RepID=A0ABS3LZV1_9PROT|nr:glycosyl hydrolase 108 family protein [Acetobacter sacchari]MBO1361450.1 hypothetical protein [Acetobacter sacchari]